MERHIAMFQNTKPLVGSEIYFGSGRKIKKAVVISHDASFAGCTMEKYFKVREKDGTIWSIVNYFTSRKEAEKSFF